MGSPDIPDKYRITLAGGADFDLDNIRIKEMPVIRLEAAIKEIPLIRTDSKIDAKTDSKIDAGLDNIRIKEIPRIDLQFGMRPTRVHMPVGLKFGVSVMGMQLLTFDVCGESMVVVEDYKPHKTEECT